MKMHYLQHVPFEHPANIADFFEQKGWVISGSHLYLNQPMPDLDDFDLLLVMGGPMGVYDEDLYPWLVEEKQLINNAIMAGKKVLGICLGAQLISECLGSKVYPGPLKEIGWYPIITTGANKLTEGIMKSEEMVFHWHGDTFDLPEGAQLLFSSLPGINQGYIVRDQVLALQFHLEMTQQSVEALLINSIDEVVEGKFIQSPSKIRQTTHFDRNKWLLFTLLDRFLME